MAQPFLSVQALQAGYGRAQVLFDVSFEVQPGEVITLLGRNGMGRSTTVKCLFGMLPMVAGTIEVDGERVNGLPSHRIARRGLALVPEGRQIFTALTVEENLVATAYASRQLDRAKVWTLERVYAFFPRLKERRSNLGSQLSGGEQQMLAMARALMTQPKLLILDEPSMGLSPVLTETIFQVIDKVSKEGMTVVLVEQNANLALQAADRGYVMDSGNMLMTGPADMLLQDPKVQEAYLGA